MTTLDLTQVELQVLITHHVGNKLRDEKYILSGEATSVDEETRGLLLKYFLSPFLKVKFLAVYPIPRFSHLGQYEAILLGNKLWTLALNKKV